VGRARGRIGGLHYLLLLPVLALLGFALALPLVSLFDASLTETTPLGDVLGRSLGGYERALETPLYRDALLTTLGLSVPAAFLCVALSYPVAYYLAYRANRWRNVVLFLIVISTFASFIVRVYAWRIILGDSGVINDGLRSLGLIDEPLRFLIYSRWAVLITWLSVFLPLTVLILTAAMMNIRAELIENARDLGAGAVRTFTRVLLPLTMPAAVGSFVLVLIFAASDFITPEQIGGNIVFLGKFISDQFQLLNGDRQAAAALAFLLMAAFVVIYFLLSLLERSKGFYGPRPPRALTHLLDRFGGSRPRGYGLRLYTAFILIFLFAPLVVMTLYAFHSSAALGLPFRGFSLQWFDKVLSDPEMRSAARNSIQISLVAGLVVTIVGTMAAFATARHRVRGRTVLRILILMPVLLPGLLYAISLLSFYNDLGVRLSAWTVALGHVVILLPVFYVIVSTRLARFDPLLEEAARDLGATPWQSFGRVVFPLVAPSIIGAGLLTIATSWDELPVALFNAGIDNTVPLLIYTRIKVIVEPTIDAIAVLLLGATVIVMAAGRRVILDFRR
jgi:spermidine/putrescine transport system permease protein